MPDYFDGHEIVARTTNFLVTCDDNPEARFRAQNVAATCEGDLASLNDLFSTKFEARKTSDHDIWVHVLTDQQSASSNGWNYGYETDESSRILLQRAFVPPPPPPPPPDPPLVPPPNYGSAVIEFPRFVFVAELAEILMQFTGYGWGPGNSMGEGLSNLLGALLHPVGYYTTGQGPRINNWLNGGGPPPKASVIRYDFVAETQNTDKDQWSFGCAILFINYLVYQLHHPLKDVIRAGGGSLAETYARLTGRPAASAYPEFNDLLKKHIGNLTSNKMARDNIFPLYDPPQRRVQINVPDPIPYPTNKLSGAVPVQFEVKPGMFCPAAKYNFFQQHEQLEQPIFAFAVGTANASFRWSVEGMELPVHNAWTNVAINTPVTIGNPDGKTILVANNVSLVYGILDAWNASVLYLKTVATDGNCSLNVSAAVREADVNDDEASGNEGVDLKTVSWLPGDDLALARKRCNHFYAAIDTTIWGLTEKLSDLKNRPDPPSEGTVRQIADAVHELDKTVAQYAKDGHMTVDEVWDQMGHGEGLRSPHAPAPALDLKRMRLPERPATQDDTTA